MAAHPSWQKRCKQQRLKPKTKAKPHKSEQAVFMRPTDAFCPASRINTACCLFDAKEAASSAMQTRLSRDCAGLFFVQDTTRHVVIPAQAGIHCIKKRSHRFLPRGNGGRLHFLYATAINQRLLHYLSRLLERLN
jgi:hypothetical protein